MIYTHDRQRAISSRHVRYIEIRDQGDLKRGGRLTGGRDKRVYAVDALGGTHQLSPYGATEGSVQAIFDDAVRQVGGDHAGLTLAAPACPHCGRTP